MWKSALQILQMPEESPSLVRVYLSTTSWSTPLLTSFLWWMRSRFLRSVLHQNSANFSESNSDSSLKWKSQVKFPSGSSTQCAATHLEKCMWCTLLPRPMSSSFVGFAVCSYINDLSTKYIFHSNQSKSQFTQIDSFHSAGVLSEKNHSKNMIHWIRKSYLVIQISRATNM